jgi:hypothetical protein
MPTDVEVEANKKKSKEDKDRERASIRLRRCAEHFLSAGDRAYGEGEVLSELNAETVLHYVIALEGLLAGDEQEHTELTRKVSQRAAVLAGNTDARRLEIERLVRGAYGARSKYAHGDTPKDEIDLPALRRIVRRCLLARLAIGDPTPAGALREVADQALLSHEILERYVHQPLGKFSQRVRGLVTFAHGQRCPRTVRDYRDPTPGLTRWMATGMPAPRCGPYSPGPTATSAPMTPGRSGCSPCASGPDLEPYAAAAVTGTPLPSARRTLDVLVPRDQDPAQVVALWAATPRPTAA